MTRFASLLTISAISVLTVAILVAPTTAGDYGRGKHGYSAHGYDDDIDCYPVTKIYDYHGRPALFGGTQCQDEHGDVWIKPDSRHLIRYLEDHDEHGSHHGGYGRDDHYND